MYGDNYGMFHSEWVDFGIETTFVEDGTDPQCVAAAVRPNTK